MPEEMEKSLREMPRDAEVIELLKKVSEEGLQELHMAAHRSISKTLAVFFQRLESELVRAATICRRK